MLKDRAVLLANQKTLGRTVALKVLPPELAAEDPVKETRFREEAKVTGRLFHPNIPTVYHMGRSKGLTYIAMQYIEGVPFDDWAAKGYEIADAVKCFAQVASALTTAHEQAGIAHRDIKPGNILVDKEGNAHLLDFGIAKGEESRDLTEHGMIVGSPLYMSPEQARGELCDGRSDVFSLGCTMYRVLTGEKPYNAENKRELLLDRMKLHKMPAHKLPPPVSKIKPEIPKSLSRIIEKCMHPLKKFRYQTAAELLDDLETLKAILGADEKDKEKELGRFSFMVTHNLNFVALLGPGLLAFMILLGGILAFLYEQREAMKPQPAFTVTE